MKRNLVAALLFACAVIIAVAAEVAKDKPSPSGEIKDPIISMMMATSIDAKGKLVNPRFSFPQTEKQITAIVQLGNIKGSQLTVTWYKTFDDGDERLFEQKIQVKSHERAFSVAKNPGMFLSAGNYKVVATLDGQTEDMEFDITPPRAAPKKTSDTREQRHFAGQTEFKDDRVVAAATNWGGLLQPISYEPVSDQSQVRRVASPQSGAAQSIGSTAAPGQPPVVGSSGTAPQSASAPLGPDADDCEVFIGVLAGELTNNICWTADTVPVDSWARCTSSFIERVSVIPKYNVGANMNAGSLQILGEYSAGEHGFPGATFYLDPCRLSGGSDLPGTKIQLNASTWYKEVRSQKSANNYVTLGDDTLAPRVYVVSTPARGSKVKPGDKINLKVTAQERRKGGPWQTGVKMIQVIALPGGQVGEPWVNSASPLSQKCEQKTWERKYEATYTVPNNPPPIIKICALAEDYVGNEASNCGDFPTGEWYGTLREHAQGNIYNDTVEVHFSFNEERDGTIKGTGRVAGMTSEPVVFNRYTITRALHVKPDEAEFPISGKRVGDGFQLELQVPKGQRLKVDITSDNGTTEGARSVFVSEPSYHPKVKAQDGATNSFHTNLGGKFQVDATIEIHRAKQ